MLLGNSRNRFEIFVGFLCVVRFLVGKRFDGYTTRSLVVPIRCNVFVMV